MTVSTLKMRVHSWGNTSVFKATELVHCWSTENLITVIKFFSRLVNLRFLNNNFMSKDLQLKHLFFLIKFPILNVISKKQPPVNDMKNKCFLLSYNLYVPSVTFKNG